MYQYSFIAVNIENRPYKRIKGTLVLSVNNLSEEEVYGQLYHSLATNQLIDIKHDSLLKLNIDFEDVRSSKIVIQSIS